jgi:ATP-binding cassette subfamily F protein uup
MDKIVDHLFVLEGNNKVKDFPGNYSVYRSYLDEKERLNKITLSKQKSNDKIKAVKNQNSYDDRLSYKEKVELENLESEIESMTSEKASLEAELMSGTLSQVDLEDKSLRYSEISGLLDKKEIRWLELSEKTS